MNSNFPTNFTTLPPTTHGDYSNKKEISFVLDIEALDGTINRSHTEILATCGIEMVDVVTCVLEDIGRTRQYIGHNYKNFNALVHVGLVNRLILTRGRKDNRYDDFKIIDVFTFMAEAIYTHLYQLIMFIMGNLPAYPIICIKEYQYMADGIWLKVDVDYIPF